MVPSFLEHLDKVVLNHDEASKVFRWLKDRFAVGSTLRDFPLREGVIEFYAPEQRTDKMVPPVLYFDESPENGGYYFTVYAEGKRYSEFFVQYEMNGHDFLVAFPSEREGEVPEREVDAVTRLIGFWYAAMMYMKESRTEYVHVEERRVRREKKAKGGKGKKRISYIMPKTYKIYLPDGSAEKRTFERKAEAWGVRGHKRRYKNGKEIWVKPHVRGQGQREGKEYRL